MSSFAITTDSASDLSKSFLQENQISEMSLYYTIDDVTYGEGHEAPMDVKAFYQKMREGILPKTQQVNPQQAEEKFREHLDKGEDVLHIAFSSGVSGSCNSARMAARELEEEYPDRKIIVIDSLTGSLGEAMVVIKAVRLRNQGKSLEETAQLLNEMIPNLRFYATVDDLKHLYRGGRLSKTAALLGSAIGIKPMITLDEEGKLSPKAKVRGRKQSIQALADYVESHVGSCLAENDTIYICHGDCEEDANTLAHMIEEKLGVHNFMIDYIGPVIGCHSGPGALAVTFIGDIK